MSRCIFCNMVKGTQDAIVVYEDLHFLAFMDKHPANPGHLLVIPKKHYPTFISMPANEVGELYTVAAVVAKAVRKAVRADGMNLGQSSGKVASQDVFHAHVHVLPRFKGDAPSSRWPKRKNMSPGQMLKIAREVREHLGKDAKN